MKTNEGIEQPIRTLFFQYTSLGILSMIGTSLFILADTFFIANGVGAEGLAALNIVLPMVNLFNGLGWMFGVGGATLFSIEKARNHFKEGKAIFTLTTVLAVVTALVFTFLTLSFTEPILQFLGAKTDIYSLSDSYYNIIIRFSHFFIIKNMLITFLRNDNSPRLAMIALLAGGVTNIILDYIFIFPLDMGMRGAALATAASPVVSMLVSSLHLRNSDRQLSFTAFEKQGKKIAKIFYIGFPSFLNEFSSAVVMFLFNIVLLQLVGNIGVAAYGIIANMNIIAIAIFTGMGQGFQPLVSQYFGGNRREDVKSLLKYVLTTAAILGIGIFSTGILFPDTIVAFFNHEQNQQLADLAIPGLRLYFSSFLFTGLNFAVIYFMSAIGRSRASLIISLLRGLILIVPVLFLLSHCLGTTGVWMTMAVVEGFTFIASFYALYIYRKNRGAQSK